MKLISCHIEGFGKWVDKDIDFTDGINSFFMNNGEGKTTLAAFIRAMLYGLSEYTEKTKDFVARKHYAPFSNAAFGGNMIFEYNGKEYRIERRFHEKRKKGDELKVYCNGTLTDELGEDPIGEQIFKLDEESFERTLFITAEDMELAATSGIGASLNGYGESSIDVEKASERLEKAITRYKQKKGSRGLIDDCERKIKQYRSDIENLERVDRALGAKYAQINELVSDISAVEKEISTSRDSALLLQKWKNYDTYILEAKGAEQEIEAINAKYPKGMPSDEKIAGAEKTLGDFYKADERLSVTSFGEDKQKRLDELQKVFSLGAPSETEITEIRASCERIREYDAKLKALNKGQPNDRDKALLERFKNGLPNDATLERIAILESNYKKTSERLSGYAAQTQTSETLGEPKNHKPILIAGALVGAAAIAAGAALAVAVSLLLGVILLALGVVALVSVGFAYIISRMNDIEKSRTVDNSLIDIQLDIKSAESDLKAELALLGYAGTEVLSELVRMRSDIERYRELVRIENERASKMGELSAIIAEETERADVALAKYFLDTSDKEASIRLLERNTDQWNTLLSEKKISDEERYKDTDLLCRLNDELDAFFVSFKDSLPDDARVELDALKNDSLKLKEYTKALEKSKRNAEAYKEREGLIDRPADAQNDTEELEAVLSEKRRRLAVLDGQVSDDEEYVARLDELRSALAEEEETLAEYKKRYSLLSACKELLILSDSKLTERYIAPVKNGFQKYASAVSESIGENISIDKTLSVSFEKNGAIRDSKHLSAGQRAVWALCLRLAFADELFTNETPFVVFDDPFVALDAENMLGVSRLLSSLSKDRQIIYFTCHESRDLK